MLLGEYSEGDLLSLFQFNLRLTEVVQEAAVKPEAGGLEYDDEEVEAFRHSLIDRN